jgi:hypothetical protein
MLVDAFIYELEKIASVVETQEKTASLSDKKKAKSTSARWSPKAVHKVADHLGVKWDNDPKFMRLCYGLTGKKHLDQMDSTELGKIAKTLAKRFKNRVPSAA